jgi:hypothetical protein
MVFNDMNKHLQYLKYVLKHKYYVLVYGLKLGVPIYQLIIHDWTKFLPIEWFPYVNYFYGEKNQYTFDMAWNHHQKRNPHHWQYWLLYRDDGSTEALEMPYRFILEMVADWCSAGKCITGKVEVVEWYTKNEGKYQFGLDTRVIVENLLSFVETGNIHDNNAT